IVVAVAVSGWLVAGVLLVRAPQETLSGAAGTMGGSRTNRTGGKTVAPDHVFELNTASLEIGNIGLLNMDAEPITLTRTKDTPSKVKLDVDYSYYLSVCDEQTDGHAPCTSYVRTERVLPGGTRLTLDFSKAAPLTGDSTETVTVQLSTREDERLHTYSKVTSEAATYRVKGDGTSIGFIAVP
ncbi:MAG: hypothetical protein AB7J63_12475, partial [Vicinamibacterales bacterium]